jgi:hypothetical protein
VIVISSRARACLWLSLALVVVPFGQATALPLSDFDDDTLQGWVVNVETGFTFTNPGSGGNPGGYALLEDTLPGGSGGMVLAPAAFLGDLRGYARVTWDALLPPQPTGPVRLALTGPGGSFVYTPEGEPLTNVWQSWEAPLDGGTGWSQFSGTGTFAQTLAATTVLGFGLEVSQTQSREAGLDNVELIPVPEPAVTGVLAAVLGALILGRCSGSRATRSARA